MSTRQLLHLLANGEIVESDRARVFLCLTLSPQYGLQTVDDLLRIPFVHFSCILSHFHKLLICHVVYIWVVWVVHRSLLVTCLKRHLEKTLFLSLLIVSFCALSHRLHNVLLFKSQITSTKLTANSEVLLRVWALYWHLRSIIGLSIFVGDVFRCLLCVIQQSSGHGVLISKLVYFLFLSFDFFVSELNSGFEFHVLTVSIQQLLLQFFDFCSNSVAIIFS